jgi:hypothetical protein
MRALSRICVVIAAYVCGVIGLFAAFAILFGLASLTSLAPGYWTIAGISPAIFAGAPVVGLFLVAAAVMLSAAPMLLIVVLAEAFSWRSLFVYAAPAALLGALVYLIFSPRTVGGLDQIGWIEIVLFTLSGAVAGLIYWGIAGRKAGAWRNP